MPRKRPRRLASALFLVAGALVLAACGEKYPNSTFTHLTDFNTIIDGLWNRLLLLGTIVFVFVEALLVFTLIKFRRREGAPEPKQTHGNSTLEITWTIIPALILVLIAVPTVKAIWETEAKAIPGALEVQVIGHQWWWEFRYPQYGVVTANELYLPAGRTVNFQLNSKDVIHSFWTPQLGGKRDVIANRTNYIWYTPDSSLAGSVFNGFCTEYCGSSHANMRFHVFTVSTTDFESWAAHQKENAAGSPLGTPAPAPTPKVASVAGIKVAPAAKPAPAAAVQPATEGYVFPLDKMPPHTLPQTPLPVGDREVKYDDSLLPGGDAARGHELVTNMAHMGEVPCLTCHVIKGEYMVGGKQMFNDDNAKAPNLTHFATRHTFAGGIYRADPPTLARWVKNAEHMKPGALMTTLGAGQYAPSMKQIRTTGLDDRQIADIVAYLLSLK
ncbi:MAG: cytochrome c oxidase subunit II [Gemmatimonadales bacterium]